MNNWCICWFFMHPLNGELNPICHLLTLLGGATIVVVSRLRVKSNGKDTIKTLSGTAWARHGMCELVLTGDSMFCLNVRVHVDVRLHLFVTPNINIRKQIHLKSRMTYSTPP